MREKLLGPELPVINTKTEEVGVPFYGPTYGCLGPSEVSIVYKGSDENLRTAPPSIGTDINLLEMYTPKPEELLTDKHVEEVCKPKTEETCRYLTLDNYGWGCAKLSGDMTPWSLDDKVEKNEIRAVGNNCGGRFRILPGQELAQPLEVNVP